jgi:hypothetical protein
MMRSYHYDFSYTFGSLQRLYEHLFDDNSITFKMYVLNYYKVHNFINT